MPQPLRASIAGGGARSIGSSEGLVLDASASFDPDVSPTDRSGDDLTFTWSCNERQLNASTNASSPSCVDAAGGIVQLPAARRVEFPAGTFAPLQAAVRVFKLTVGVGGALTWRNSTAEVSVTVVEGESVRVELEPLAALRSSASERLVLRGGGCRFNCRGEQRGGRWRRRSRVQVARGLARERADAHAG